MEDEDGKILKQPLDLPGGENPLPHKNWQQKGNSKKAIVTVLVALIIVGISAGAYLLLNKKGGSPKTTPETVASNTQPSEQSTSNDIPVASNTESFTSSPYRITFAYPKSWTVTEANDNGIRIESPEFTYVKNDGTTTNGYFRIYVRKGARTDDGKYIGKGVTTQSSDKLKYTNPTPSQRKETNLSFFGIDDSSNFAFFLIAGNFDLKKGDTLGPNYGKEAETIIIAGGYSEASLKDDLQTNPVPLDWFKTTNAYKQAITIVESLELI
jgi:hypothetical protein